jgi:hypothetical protein
MSDNEQLDGTTNPAEARAAELERRLAELEASSRQRLIRAELKAEAVRAGMVDLDGLKLVDATAVMLTADGEVAGAAALMQTLRRAKPWLFGQPSASSAAIPPPAQVSGSRRATDMTYEEWQAARSELLRHR